MMYIYLPEHENCGIDTFLGLHWFSARKRRQTMLAKLTPEKKLDKVTYLRVWSSLNWLGALM